MRAVAVHQFKEAPKVLDLPTPVAGPGEMVVRVEAAGMNPLDWKVIDGIYEGRRRHLFPLVVGVDGAGTVATVDPAVRRFRAGDRIYGQFLHDPVGTGTYAEWTLVPESIGVARIPDSWSASDAAALPTAGMTALDALERIGMAPGRTLLVVGAAGGVGSFACQIASAEGMFVIGASRRESFDRVRRLGAREVIALDDGDPTAAIRAGHPQGVDGLLDVMHPSAAFPDWSRLVRAGGVAVSTIGGAPETAAAQDGPVFVNIGLRPSTELLERLTGILDRHRLAAPVEHRITLEESPAVLAELRAGRVRGKTVIRLE